MAVSILFGVTMEKYLGVCGPWDPQDRSGNFLVQPHTNSQPRGCHFDLFHVMFLFWLGFQIRVSMLFPVCSFCFGVFVFFVSAFLWRLLLFM
jgi:hypothetical protein